jgi:hypothetical protein
VPIPKIRNRKSAAKVLVESRRKLTLQDGWRWEHCKLISKNHGGEKPDELSGFVPESGIHETSDKARNKAKNEKVRV